jgi:hypothetical protein
MHTLDRTAPAFVEMAHRIVWCTAATVDAQGRPRSRVLHPLWEWDGARLTGWIMTGPTPTKRAHIAAHPFVSCNYWAPTQDTCVAECEAAWANDEASRVRIWNLFKNAPPPVGYDPTIVPAWTSPSVPAFGVLRLSPWRLRVFPGSVMMGKGGDVLTWRR